MDKLVDRLRGIYEVGPDAEFGTRSFEKFIPPISLEAANRIEQLEKKVEELGRKLNPKLWTKEEQDIWHKNIPNTVLAFEKLRNL